ncbi:MAG: type II secretion system minor pseudopilin GspI [Pseudomonadota bacterium]
MRRFADGFTLMEVLVALAVAGVSLAAGVKVVGSYVQGSAHLQESVVAHWAAANQLLEIQLANSLPESGTQQGTLSQGGRDWHWRLRVEETPYERVRRLEVQIFDEADSDSTLSRIAGYLGTGTRW